MDKLQLKEAILKQIERPVIPAREFPAQKLGVIPDKAEIQTAALQRAIDTISGEGGGRLTLPPGRYLTGALELKSGVELHLQGEDTVISFVNEHVDLHYPVVFSHWEATPCYNYSPLIYACDAHDIALTGQGTLDGGADADHWWNWHHQVEDAWSADEPDLQLEDRRALRRMNVDGVPAAQRVFGPGHYLRPNFVQPIRCERLLLEGITLRNSPMWQLNPVMCRSLTVDGVTLSSHGANNDGCDPESCNGVYICNCRFDTGDDCISLKSGRDRDGRMADMPCENVLIENNEFADGHGGIALGSEMSGGIRRVLAVNNRFSSPNLTYALRLKTNARRGGRVEDIILADSVMDHVHGAAVHGTMLYEDGRNGSNLPVFHNITIENITAHGGDYGIFLEAFEEVPITGLTLRDIRIDGVSEPMRSMNWENPLVEHVTINGKEYPRPGSVRILGVTMEGETVKAASKPLGGCADCRYIWEVSADRHAWKEAGREDGLLITEGISYVRLTAKDRDGNTETSRIYRVLERNQDGLLKKYEWQRLACRGMLDWAGEQADGRTVLHLDNLAQEEPITREQLSGMLMPLAGPAFAGREETSPYSSVHIAIEKGFLAPDAVHGFAPDKYVNRQEMATVAMQACGVNYRNASSTMPVCADVRKVSNNYGTNVARALYFGFMELDPDGCFVPDRCVTVGEAAVILNRVADFAGL